MIDDLVTRGVTRALSDVHLAGGVPAVAAGRQRRPAADAGWRGLGRRGARRGGRRYAAKAGALAAARALTEGLNLTPNEAERHGIHLNRDGVRRTAFDLLSYPGIGMAELARVWPELGALDQFVSEQIETDAKYAVYLERQSSDIDSLRRDEAVGIPDGLDLANLAGLSQRALREASDGAAGDAGAGGAYRGHDARGAGVAARRNQAARPAGRLRHAGGGRHLRSVGHHPCFT